ncbi:DUF3077 domain-containing protein [Pseudomonas sp. MIACH]|uniref:DUF3077 domain-containing protein n=1 Tax=Pseudomonas sp. MIACH TaxID=1078355 RepID=UPI00069FF507|nr:DUF3077 domain-containing protein [Pseudomonas sp. MIACH]
MKNNRHEKAPSAPTLEAYEAVNISEDIHMTKHTEVNEKLNAGAVKAPVTVPLSFVRCNVERQDLYSVCPGVPAVDALNQASFILHSVRSALEDAGMAGLIVTPSQAWLLHMAVESAKAAIDSVTEGLEKAR